jgi:iron complex outermembrane receptor protein
VPVHTGPAAAPIVVTATPFGHTTDETPTISVHIDAEQISRAGGASIADALRDTPGISVSGFAAGASRPIIRGMDSHRVRLLEDGTSSSDVSDIGPDHGIPIDPLSARSIEVVRGAATLRYGSQAIGGVVNTINNRVPMSLPKETISAEASSSYTTVNKGAEVAGSSMARPGSSRSMPMPSGARPTTTTRPTAPQNSWFHGWGGSLGGSYFLGDGKSHVGLAVTHYDSQYGVPSDTTYIDMHQTKVMSATASIWAPACSRPDARWLLWRLQALGKESRRLDQLDLQEQGMERARRAAVQRARAGAQHGAGRRI